MALFDEQGPSTSEVGRCSGLPVGYRHHLLSNPGGALRRSEVGVAAQALPLNNATTCSVDALADIQGFERECIIMAAKGGRTLRRSQVGRRSG